MKNLVTKKILLFILFLCFMSLMPSLALSYDYTDNLLTVFKYHPETQKQILSGIYRVVYYHANFMWHEVLYYRGPSSHLEPFIDSKFIPIKPEFVSFMNTSEIKFLLPFRHQYYLYHDTFHIVSRLVQFFETNRYLDSFYLNKNYNTGDFQSFYITISALYIKLHDSHDNLLSIFDRKKETFEQCFHVTRSGFSSWNIVQNLKLTWNGLIKHFIPKSYMYHKPIIRESGWKQWTKFSVAKNKYESGRPWVPVQESNNRRWFDQNWYFKTAEPNYFSKKHLIYKKYKEMINNNLDPLNKELWFNYRFKVFKIPNPVFIKWGCKDILKKTNEDTYTFYSKHKIFNSARNYLKDKENILIKNFSINKFTKEFAMFINEIKVTNKKSDNKYYNNYNNQLPIKKKFEDNFYSEYLSEKSGNELRDLKNATKRSHKWRGGGFRHLVKKSMYERFALEEEQEHENFLDIDKISNEIKIPFIINKNNIELNTIRNLDKEVYTRAGYRYKKLTLSSDDFFSKIFLLSKSQQNAFLDKDYTQKLFLKKNAFFLSFEYSTDFLWKCTDLSKKNVLLLYKPYYFKNFNNFDEWSKKLLFFKLNHFFRVLTNNFNLSDSPVISTDKTTKFLSFNSWLLNYYLKFFKGKLTPNDVDKIYYHWFNLNKNALNPDNNNLLKNTLNIKEEKLSGSWWQKTWIFKKWVDSTPNVNRLSKKVQKNKLPLILLEINEDILLNYKTFISTKNAIKKESSLIKLNFSLKKLIYWKRHLEKIGYNFSEDYKYLNSFFWNKYSFSRKTAFKKSRKRMNSVTDKLYEGDPKFVRLIKYQLRKTRVRLSRAIYGNMIVGPDHRARRSAVFNIPHLKNGFKVPVKLRRTELKRHFTLRKKKGRFSYIRLITNELKVKRRRKILKNKKQIIKKWNIRPVQQELFNLFGEKKKLSISNSTVWKPFIMSAALKNGVSSIVGSVFNSNFIWTKKKGKKKVYPKFGWNKIKQNNFYLLNNTGLDDKWLNNYPINSFLGSKNIKNKNTIFIDTDIVKQYCNPNIDLKKIRKLFNNNFYNNKLLDLLFNRFYFYDTFLIEKLRYHYFLTTVKNINILKKKTSKTNILNFTPMKFNKKKIFSRKKLAEYLLKKKK